MKEPLMQPIAIRKCVTDALEMLAQRGLELRERFDTEALDRLLIDLNDGSELALFDVQNFEDTGSMLLDLSQNGLRKIGTSLAEDGAFIVATVRMLVVMQRNMSARYEDARLHRPRVLALRAFWSRIRDHILRRVAQIQHAAEERERRRPEVDLPDSDMVEGRSHDDPSLRIVLRESAERVVTALLGELRSPVFRALRVSVLSLGSRPLYRIARRNRVSAPTLTRACQRLHELARAEAVDFPADAHEEFAFAVVEALRETA